MTSNDIVELAEGLVVNSLASIAAVAHPPFTLIVPKGTNLKEQYTDGQDNLGTLEERLLRIKQVKAVRVGDGPGVSVESYQEGK